MTKPTVRCVRARTSRLTPQQRTAPQPTSRARLLEAAAGQRASHAHLSCGCWAFAYSFCCRCALICPCALASSRPAATYFLALEDSDLCARRMCGAYRGLTLHLKDASGADVLRCKRPFTCTCLCGLPCCCFTYLNPQTMEIVTMAPGGMEGPKLGAIRQTGSCCSLSNKLEVLDAHGQVIYILSAYSLQCGPNCCCHEYEFKIETPDGTHTGASIKNVFPGAPPSSRAIGPPASRGELFMPCRADARVARRVQLPWHVHSRGQFAGCFPDNGFARVARHLAWRGFHAGLPLLRAGQPRVLRQRLQVGVPVARFRLKARRPPDKRAV